MGIDVCMFVEASGEPSDLWLPQGWHFTEAEECDKDSGATHEVWCDGHRYYGIGYERGPWPIIAGVLMSLFASPNISRVWYFGDISDIENSEPITREEVARISMHYMKHGERPYRDPGYTGHLNIVDAEAVDVTPSRVIAKSER